MEFRPATYDDRHLLLEWRNDPVTQACSRSTAEVTDEAHRRWMLMNVVHGQSRHVVVIAEYKEVPFGVVRFDTRQNNVMAVDVSITIAPKYRGLGLAYPMLNQALSQLSDITIYAEVKRDNIASRKLFEKCGFEEVARRGHFIEFTKDIPQK